MQYIIHALQWHYSDDSVMRSVNYRYIIVGNDNQHWGALHYSVLSVLQEVTVGHIVYVRLCYGGIYVAIINTIFIRLNSAAYPVVQISSSSQNQSLICLTI
jgi:hypothetical protein